MTWTLSSAEREFGAERRTIAKRLAAIGEQPDRRGRFATRQILAALFGDLHAQRSALAAELVEAARLKNELRRGELISLADCTAVVEVAAAAIRQKLLNCSLPDPEKRRLLDDIFALRKLTFEDAQRLATEAESETPPAEKSAQP